MKGFLLLLSFVQAGQLGIALGAGSPPPAFPSEVFTVEQLGENIRSSISSKMSEMRMTYRTREVPHGGINTRVDFLDSGDVLVASVFLNRSINSDSTERMEEVLVQSPRGRMLFKERIETRGRGLKFSDPAKKIFLEAGASTYGLQANEESKTVLVSSDGNELFRFQSFLRFESEKITHTDIYYGRTKLLSIREALSADRSLRGLKYVLTPAKFKLQAFGWESDRIFSETAIYRVESKRLPGKWIDTQRYFLDERELSGLNSFMESFGRDIYSPLFTLIAGEFISMLLMAEFPVTQRVATIGKSSRFLDQLVLVRTQLGLVASNPAMLPTTLPIVIATINSFIAAIQDQTLVINDTRPNGK